MTNLDPTIYEVVENLIILNKKLVARIELLEFDVLSLHDKLSKLSKDDEVEEEIIYYYALQEYATKHQISLPVTNVAHVLNLLKRCNKEDIEYKLEIDDDGWERYYFPEYILDDYFKE